VVAAAFRTDGNVLCHYDYRGCIYDRSSESNCLVK
jgi:hypothetical protein